MSTLSKQNPFRGEHDVEEMLEICFTQSHKGDFWPLCCLSFFDLRVLISPLVSSNSSF